MIMCTAPPIRTCGCVVNGSVARYCYYWMYVVKSFVGWRSGVQLVHVRAYVECSVG